MELAMVAGRRFLALLVLSIAGCGGETPSHEPVATTLTVWNRSQFELLELYVHDGDTFDGATDLLSAPLAVEASIDVAFTTGQFVTVVRKKIDVGDEISLTTAVGLDDVTSEGYTLIVFDESFRLMNPS
jgi:hypothetical protein